MRENCFSYHVDSWEAIGPEMRAVKHDLRRKSFIYEEKEA